MEQPSFPNIVSQFVDYLGQTHKWTDTNVISSYKDICQEKLREEYEEKGQEKLTKTLKR
jgi:hypothetical protein